MATFEILSTHIEGTQIRTLARVVVPDGTFLQPAYADTGAGEGPTLVAEIFDGTRKVYRQELGVANNGLVTPRTGDGWTQAGKWNFSFLWDPAQLLAQSPAFRFRAPRQYLIRYTHTVPELYGDIISKHRVNIIPA